MSSSLSSLFRRNRTLSFGLLALLLVSALFLLVTPPTSADTPVEGKGDADSPLYADAKRAALSEAIANVEPSSEELQSMSFTPCVDGMADIFPCDNVDLMSFMTLEDLGGSNTNDIWGWTDPEDGKEYALVGRNNGTSFVDITDPINPVFLGELPGHNGSSSNWRDVKVYADYAFIVSEASGDGMQVFDLTRLRNVANPPETFTEDAHYPGWGNAHNIVINEDSGYAYGVGTDTCAAGLDMVDISDPLNPTFAGCFDEDGYTHDAQCVNYEGPDADYADSEICLNSNEDTLTIVDVTDKANPSMIARETYPDPGYTHQGWLTEDHRYFLQDDETDEVDFGHNTYTYIWDLLDLDDPQLIGIYDSGIPASDHNLYIRENYAYQSNYAAGLRILDITDIANANLELAGHFDVWPESDAAGFDGSWSNYPYFESGNIIVTSRGLGFMVVKTAFEPDFSVTATPPSLDVCVPEDAVYMVNVGQNVGFSDPVTLSTSGEPAGAGVSFSMNNMPPPFTSTLTITTTNAMPDSYEIEIVGTASPTHTHSTMVGLNLTDMAPGDVTLMMPADMAPEVSRMPTFEWMAADGATSYHLEVATDMDLTEIVIDVMIEETSYEAESRLDGETTYYWRVTASNGCGDGNTSDAFSFTTEAAPPILVVDDQNGSSNELSAYTDVLDALGEEYDVFDTAANGNVDPTAEELAPYLMVIWFSGADFSSTAGPDPTGEAELGDYLDENEDRCLFISGQDYLWGQGGGSAGNPTPFMMEYLGLESTGTDVSHANVSGSGAFILLQPDTLAYPFTNYSDELNPDDTASVAFTGDGAGGTNAGISKVTDNYRTTYWGFPFEAIPSAAEREETMATVLDWCEGIQIETGILNGTVIDDLEEPLEGAMVTVHSDDYTFTAMTNEDGDYSMEVIPGMYDVTASAENYESEMVPDVDIMANETQTLDFMLAGSRLTYSPDMIEETMMTDQMVTNTIMLTNDGPLDLEFDLITYNYEGPMLQVRGLNSSNLLGGAQAFGINLGDGQSVTFMTDDPANVTNIAPAPQNFYGGDFLAGDFSRLYAVDNGSMRLYAIDTMTGDMTVIGDTPSNDGQTWTGMAGDPTDGTMYGMSTDCSTNTLYTINVVTGEPTTIGTDASGPCIIAIAINAAGELYGADLGDNLVSIDKSTGAITVIGALGVDINNAQGMDFDEEADILYLAAYSGGGALPAELRRVDTDTGASTLVGPIGNGNSIDSLAIATGGGDPGPMWAMTYPESGVIPANSTMEIDVVFNSTGMTETGTYSAILHFNGTWVNDNEVAEMPLVMHLDGLPNDGDANGDGVPDSEQDNVATLPNAGDDEGYVTLEVPEGVTLTDVEAMTAPMTMPMGVDSMPQGLFGFTLEGLEPGEGITLTLFIENSDTPMDSYWKYNEMTDTWTDHSAYVTYGEEMVGDDMVTTIMVYLEDGGPGDADGDVNGTIVDPGGPTVAAAETTSISLAGLNSGTSMIWQPIALLALLLLAVMAGGAMMLRKRGLA